MRLDDCRKRSISIHVLLSSRHASCFLSLNFYSNSSKAFEPLEALKTFASFCLTMLLVKSRVS